MLLDVALARRCLKDSDFNCLFIEGLGWDRYASHLDVTVDDRPFTLSAVAQKRGMVAFVWQPPAGGHIPNYPTRRKVERKVAKSVHEHLIVYVDGTRTMQVWQWVKREAGKPTACREHTYHHTQPGDALIQKLQALAFSIEDEEGLTLFDVTSGVRSAFDVKKVTKRFYDRFKTEHAAFTKFLKGIPDEGLERWYVSVMLNRLMFIYFIQKKGFLDGDADYLRHKLAASRDQGKDRYYRDFLCPLFFEGFARRPEERSAATNRLLGQVPYLNGGLFLKHQIEEQHGRTIEIPDKALEKIFAFFDAYRWHLDERPLRRDDEINPDVLGYIFEKYINQKQMGAYYTKEDITGYISQNTVIPRLFDMARAKCKVAFEGDQAVWRLLAADPDRYIYEPVRRGVIAEDGSVIPESVLPDFVQKGMNDPKARMFDKRYNLGKAEVLEAPNSPNLALPTETWREYVERRNRCLELCKKLAAGKVRDINDLITLNLDIRQFAQDVVENAEGPDLLVAFWNAIQGITVLDPACGSGAFLFAALNILEPLYEACLDRMTAFLEEWGKAGRKRHPNYTKLFTETLGRVAEHPNRRYFVLKSIVIQNLYGVDIMDEAVEICKLRLFLKLVAQIEQVEQIEPLPDIDFNIRSGNTLVGFATRESVREALSKEQSGQQKMVYGEEAEALKKIEEKADDVDRLFTLFRQQQTELGGTVTATDKEALRKRLGNLEDELNRLLATQYSVEPNKTAQYQGWLKSHLPFHWFVEFYGIMKRGGFDVVLGNPPYLETRQIDYAPKSLRSAQTRAVHAMFVERSLSLLAPMACTSMIVPLAIVCTQRMELVQAMLEASRAVWYANFAWRPGKLFDTVNRALTIYVAAPADNRKTFSTHYQKWYSEARHHLMPCIRYMNVPKKRKAFWVPKLGHDVEEAILQKVCGAKAEVGNFAKDGPHKIFYRTTGGLYWKVFTDFAPAFRVNGRRGHSSRETSLSVSHKDLVHPLIAALSSDLFWWWYTVTSNLRDLNPTDVRGFPIPEDVVSDTNVVNLGEKYVKDLAAKSTTLVRQQKQTGKTETQCFKIQLSKPLIDEIDQALAAHYGFSEEELDFIINYDIKYRMGGGEDDGDEE